MIIGFFCFGKDDIIERGRDGSSTKTYSIFDPITQRFGVGARLNILNRWLLGGYITNNGLDIIPPPPEPTQQNEQLKLPFDE